MEMPVNETKLNQLLTRVLHDWAAAMSAPLVVMGDRLGLYRALAGAGPVLPEELAERVAVPAPYIREWLANQAAGGYVEHDADTGRYWLSDEQALVLADDTSTACMLGAFQIAAAYTRDEPRVSEAIRNGRGFGWHEHDPEVFAGVERFYRPSYQANIASSWIPALEGVEAKLRTGAQVADVGCGHGLSTIFMAEAYPNSTFGGFDYHEASIERARELAAESGVSSRVRFAVASATTFPGSYDLVALFDCFHDLGDPVVAAAHIRAALEPDGTCMVVEPAAGDRVADNLTPLGRGYYAASTLACVPSSLAQETGLALGAQAGEARLTRVLRDGGFTRIRQAAATPFNIVLEARP
jgi:SAM-dependent methyltransferase